MKMIKLQREQMNNQKNFPCGDMHFNQRLNNKNIALGDT
jgi:hypothetical protein